MRALLRLRWSLSRGDGGVDPVAAVQPFADVVEAEDTTALSTGLAIASLRKIVTSPFFDLPDTAGAAARGPFVRAMSAVVHALTHCRFESVDSHRDELVLMKMLQAQSACLSSPVGRYLGDKDVWCMVETCYRICRVMRPPNYSFLMCETCESILREMIGIVFSRGNWTGDGSGAAADDKDKGGPAADAETKALPAKSNPGGDLKRFGLPCALKIMDLVCRLCDAGGGGASGGGGGMASGDTDTGMEPEHKILLGCQLLLSILESGGAALSTVPAIARYFEDNVSYFLVCNSSTSNPLVFSMITRIVYMLFLRMRDRLRPQIETLFACVHLRVLERRALPFEIRETLLESLVDLSRLPGFFQTLNAVYDSQPFARPLCESLLKLLCRAARPVGGVLTNNHVLALRALIGAMESLGDRASARDAKKRVAVAGRRRPRGGRTDDGSGGFGDGGADAKRGGDGKDGKDGISSASLPPALAAARERRRALAQAIAEWNKKPSRGLEALRQCGAMGAGLSVDDMVDKEADRQFARHLREVAAHNKPIYSARFAARRDRQRKRQRYEEQLLPPAIIERKLGPQPAPPASPPPPRPSPSARFVKREAALRPAVRRLARLFRRSRAVDAELLGEFLCEPAQLNHLLMDEFVDTFDFRGLTIDAALRTFLEGLRLPKEGQQIDRCVQAFAKAYHAQNPDYLESEDAIYTLVFSLIMLNTDLHNPLVPKKMSLSDYLANTKYVDDGQDAPRDELERLYKTIATRPFSLSSEDGGAAGGAAAAGTAVTDAVDTTTLISRELWRDMVHRSRTFLSDKDGDGDTQVDATAIEDAIKACALDAPIFESLWKPMLRALSPIYGMARDDRVRALVERGYQLITSLSTRFARPEALDAAFASLCKHTNLLEELKDLQRRAALVVFASDPVSLHAVRLLFSTAIQHAAELGPTAWPALVQCLAQLDRMEVLPKALATMNNFAPGARSRADVLTLTPAPFKEAPAADTGVVSSFFSTVSYYLSAAAAPGAASDSKTSQYRKLLQVARAFMGRCRTEALVPATRIVPLPALRALLGAIEAACDPDGLLDTLHSVCWDHAVYTSVRRRHAAALFKARAAHRLPRSQSSPVMSDQGIGQLSAAVTASASNMREPEALASDGNGIKWRVGDGPDALARAVARDFSGFGNRILSHHEKEEKDYVRRWLDARRERGVTVRVHADPGSTRFWVWEHGWLPRPLREALLSVHLYTQVVLRNKDRVSGLLPLIRQFFSKLINPDVAAATAGREGATAKQATSKQATAAAVSTEGQQKSESSRKKRRRDVPPSLVEAAVVSTLVVCSQLLEDGADSAAAAVDLLSIAQTVDETRCVLVAEQLMYGVATLVREHRAAIRGAQAWRVVLNLVHRGIKHVATIQAGLEALALAATDPCCTCVSLQTLQRVMSIALKYGLALGSHPAAARCVDILAALHARAGALLESRPELPKSMRTSVATPGAQTPTSAAAAWDTAEWRGCWKPLLESFCALALQLPPVTAAYAIGVLKRVLTGSAGSAASSPAPKTKPQQQQPQQQQQLKVGGVGTPRPDRIIREVLSPFVCSIAKRRAPTEGRNTARAQLARLQQRALTLLTKVFLQRLPELLPAADFHHSLVAVVNACQRCLEAGAGGALADMAREALKNVLLVLAARGAFSPKTNATGKELWALTWAHVDSSLPGLREELFPDAPAPGTPKRNGAESKVEEKKGGDDVKNAPARKSRHPPSAVAL